MSKAREVALALASKPPLAMRLTKRRLREVSEPDFEDAFAAGAAIEAEAFDAGEPQREMEQFFAVRAGRSSPDNPRERDGN